MSDSQRVVVYILISNKKNYFIKLLSLRICYPEETYFFFFLASFMVALTHMPFRCISQNLSLIRFIKLNVIDRIDLSQNYFLSKLSEFQYQFDINSQNCNVIYKSKLKKRKSLLTGSKSESHSSFSMSYKPSILMLYSSLGSVLNVYFSICCWCSVVVRF